MNITIKKSKLTLIKTEQLIKEHLQSLKYPIESYMEDQIYNSDIYLIYSWERVIGYTAINELVLNSFYVVKEFLRIAPAIFEKTVKELKIENVIFMSQDSLMNTLMCEWEYDIEKDGCFFVETSKVLEEPVTAHDFRQAKLSDLPHIKEISKDFFDEASGGFDSLEERIKAKTIFVLQNDDDYLGFGVIEELRLLPNVISIGMFTNSKFRKMGVAKTILQNLRYFVNQSSKIAVAGCWYYNTLSRKSIESAGLALQSILLSAKLKQKEKLPLRTGNPPGELVE